MLILKKFNSVDEVCKLASVSRSKLVQIVKELDIKFFYQTKKYETSKPGFINASFKRKRRVIEKGDVVRILQSLGVDQKLIDINPSVLDIECDIIKTRKMSKFIENERIENFGFDGFDLSDVIKKTRGDYE